MEAEKSQLQLGPLSKIYPLLAMHYDSKRLLLSLPYQPTPL